MKYYFISFSYEKDRSLHTAHTLINCHPLAWQRMANEEFTDESRIISWQEITKEEYDEYNGWIG